MVKVYQHGSQKDEIGFFPVFTIKNQGNKYGKNKMQKIMRKGFEQCKI